MPVKTEYIETLFNRTPIFVYIVILCAAVVCVTVSFKDKGFIEGARRSSFYLMLLYAIMVICITVVFRQEGQDLGIKYTPFWSYARMKHIQSRILSENIMNVVAFLPIGFLLKIGFNKLKLWHAALVGCCFSVFIELLQLVFKRGQCEVDDVIHNSLGCVIGFVIVKGIAKFYNHTRWRN